MMKRSVNVYKMGVQETQLSSSHLEAVRLPPLLKQVRYSPVLILKVNFIDSGTSTTILFLKIFVIIFNFVEV